MLAFCLATSGVAHIKSSGGHDEHSLTPSGSGSKHSKHSKVNAASTSSSSGYTRQLVLKGERHTSTNFLVTMLNQNFGDAICDDKASCNGCGQCAACDTSAAEPMHDDTLAFCCWKHGYADTSCSGWTASSEDPAYVFLVRSVYPWLLAMHVEPYEYNGPGDKGKPPANFSDFIRTPFAYTPVPYETSKKSTLDNQSNPVQLWNEKVRSYVAVIENSSYTSTQVTHYGLYHLQSLRESMQPLLDDGYKLTGGSRNSTDFQYPAFSDDLLAYEDGSKLNDEQKFSHVFSQAKFDVAKAYEEGQQWKELLTQDDLDFINAEVDHALMGRWGMEIVTTALAAGKQASKVGDRLEHHRRLTFLDHAMMR